MRLVGSFTRRLLLSASLAALVSACSGGMPVAGAPDSAVNVSPAVAKGENLIYWGDFHNSTITVYSSIGVNGKKLGQITKGLSYPERLFVDKKLNVYATNSYINTITAYKPGATSPFLTIRDDLNEPNGLTVDAAGTVYCGNSGNATITVYPAGHTKPSLIIPVSSVNLATDSSDNLYASAKGNVLKFAPGSTKGKNLGLRVGSAGALEVDHNGNLIVVDGSTLDYFPAGQKSPSKRIKVTSGSAMELSLSGDEQKLYVSVAKTPDGPFLIQSIAYPNGTKLANKLTTHGGEWPVAVSPDDVLGG